MITRSLRLKLAAPAAIALFAAVSVGFTPVAANANSQLGSYVTAQSNFSSSNATTQQPVHTASSKKKKKKRKKKKRRGSHSG